ncbi:restriction endonuclease [Colwellia sp. RE-S-Sl-9]
MVKKNTGKDFELLVAQLHKSYLKDLPSATLKQDVFIDGPDGKRQIDVLIEYQFGLYAARHVIECKDYKRTVGVAKVDEFHSKMIDIRANSGVIVSSKGFSKSAINKARRLNISLCTAHQAGSEKWKIEVPIPVMLVTHVVNGLECSMRIAGSGEDTNEYIGFKTSQIATINGIGIHEWLPKLWNTQTIKPDDLNDFCLTSREETSTLKENTTATYKHDFNENPALISDDKGVIHELDVFEIRLKIKRVYLSGYLNDIHEAKLLIDKCNNKGTIFLGNDSFINSIGNLKRYNNAKDIPDANYICSFAISPLPPINPIED